MARKNSQNRTAKQKSTKHVKSWTGPKPPARVRPVGSVEPKPFNQILNLTIDQMLN